MRAHVCASTICLALTCCPIWFHMLCMYVCTCAHEYSVRAQSFLQGNACMCVYASFNKAYDHFHCCELIHVCEYVWHLNDESACIFCLLRLRARKRFMLPVMAARWCMCVYTCVHRCMYVRMYVDEQGLCQHCHSWKAMHVWVHEQGERSARRCVYERMCVCVNKEYVTRNYACTCIFVCVCVCVSKAYARCDCCEVMHARAHVCSWMRHISSRYSCEAMHART